MLDIPYCSGRTNWLYVAASSADLLSSLLSLQLFGGLQFPTLLPLRAPSDELFTFDLGNLIEVPCLAAAKHAWRLMVPV